MNKKYQSKQDELSVKGIIKTNNLLQRVSKIKTINYKIAKRQPAVIYLSIYKFD